LVRAHRTAYLRLGLVHCRLRRCWDVYAITVATSPVGFCALSVCITSRFGLTYLRSPDITPTRSTRVAVCRFVIGRFRIGFTHAPRSFHLRPFTLLVAACTLRLIFCAALAHRTPFITTLFAVSSHLPPSRLHSYSFSWFAFLWF